MDKSQRQKTILSLIAERAMGTQEDLVDALRAMDIQVTQATVSRDIRELHLVKRLGENGTHYVKPEAEEHSVTGRLQRMLRESVLSVACSENLLVVQTLSGSANVAGEALDSLEWPEILGTIAGDNTVLVVARSAQEAPEVAQRLKKLTK